MKKPTPKRELAIEWHDERQRVIYLWGTNDALQDVETFGLVHGADDGAGKCYQLRVSPQYDWQEVIDYINNYGQN